MFMLLMVVVIVVLFAIAVVAAERREVQYKALIASLREARTADAAIIEGLQQQVAALLEDKADLNAELAKKDNHIDGLVEEIKKATEKVAVLEKLSAEAAVELEAATASEFALKAKLANAEANYAKVEDYAFKAMKKASPSIFGDCNPRLDEKFVFEDELGIHWFK